MTEINTTYDSAGNPTDKAIKINETSSDKPFYKSKKWMIAFLGGVIAPILYHLLGVPSQYIIEAGGVVIAYILGQGAIDFRAAKKIKNGNSE